MAARSSARRAVGGAAVAAVMLAGLAVAIPAPAQAAVDGGAHGWGSDVNGRLGNGATTGDVLTSTAAVGALAGRRVTQVSAGDRHSCALAGGQAFCWGANNVGQLGTGTPGADEAAPVAVSGLSGKTVTRISAGTDTTCAIADSALYCWGSDAHQKLGNGASGASASPTLVTADGSTMTGAAFNSAPVTHVSVGAQTVCAVVTIAGAGRAYCWGSNDDLQLGTTSVLPGSEADRPVQVAYGLAAVLYGKTVTDVAVGISYDTRVCVVASGDVYCWGFANDGALGAGPQASNQATPQLVPGTTGATAVTAGSGHTCAIISGAAWCWGFNGSGQLGYTDGTASTDVPTAVSTSGALSGTVVAISAGYYHTCALTRAGGHTRAACWGNNGNGRLGIGSVTPSLWGTPLSAGYGALLGVDLRGISAATSHTLVARSSSPGAPTGLVAAPGTGSVTVTWNAPTDTGGAPITEYLVEVRAGAQVVNSCSTDPAVRSCSLTGLVGGVGHTVSVRAVNLADLAGGQTAEAAFTPAAPPPPPAPPAPVAPPAPPADVTAPTLRWTRAGPSVALSSVTASWAGSDDTGVASYRVRTRAATTAGRLGAWGPETTLPATTTARTLRFAAGATICLQVTAVDPAGNAGSPVVSCVAFAADDRSLAPKPRAWAVVKARGYTFGRALSTRQRLATLTLPRATGSRLALIVRKGPGAGTVGVYVKGRKVATVPLGARRTALRQLVVLKVRTAGLPVVLRVDKPGAGVVVDGIAVLK